MRTPRHKEGKSHLSSHTAGKSQTWGLTQCCLTLKAIPLTTSKKSPCSFQVYVFLHLYLREMWGIHQTIQLVSVRLWLPWNPVAKHPWVKYLNWMLRVDADAYNARWSQLWPEILVLWRKKKNCIYILLTWNNNGRLKWKEQKEHFKCPETSLPWLQ